MYQSKLGRFSTTDPDNIQAMLDITRPQSWNAYAYVNNQPTRSTDPTGKCDTWKFWQCIANGAKYGHWKSNDTTADRFREEFRQNLVGVTTTDGEYIDLSKVDWSKESNESIFYVADVLRNVPKSQRDNSNVNATPTPPEINVEVPDVDIPIGGAKRRSNPNEVRAQMPKAPESLQRVGRAINWGSGETGALQRIQNITRQEVINSGVKRAEAEAARDFYKAVTKADPLNKAAPLRAELMQKVVDFLSP
jgi:hypothetical protein